MGQDTAKAQSDSATSPKPPSSVDVGDPAHRYTVPLSFAGSERAFAESVAHALLANGITVFYDKFEQQELWGKDLFVTLRQVYTRECRYVVMLLSDNYLSRMWTSFERQQIIERLATEHGQDNVLPI